MKTRSSLPLAVESFEERLTPSRFGHPEPDRKSPSLIAFLPSGMSSQDGHLRGLPVSERKEIPGLLGPAPVLQRPLVIIVLGSHAPSSSAEFSEIPIKSEPSEVLTSVREVVQGTGVARLSAAQRPASPPVTTGVAFAVEMASAERPVQSDTREAPRPDFTPSAIPANLPVYVVDRANPQGFGYFSVPVEPEDVAPDITVTPEPAKTTPTPVEAKPSVIEQVLDVMIPSGVPLHGVLPIASELVDLGSQRVLTTLDRLQGEIGTMEPWEKATWIVGAVFVVGGLTYSWESRRSRRRIDSTIMGTESALALGEERDVERLRG